MAIRPGKYPQLADRDWLDREYREKGRSCADIAAEVGCTASNVDLRLRQHDIPRRGRWEAVTRAQQACERCGKLYTPSGQNQKYCSQRCRYGTLICVQCQREFVAVPDQRSNKNITYKRKFCSQECRRDWTDENARNRWVNKDGYVTVPEPTMTRRLNKNGYAEVQLGERQGSNNGRVLEHRWMMERRLGRRLYLHEEVHHRNGHRGENDRFCPFCGAEFSEIHPEVRGDVEWLHCQGCGHDIKANLELWTTSQPKGQRVQDKLAWAEEFLAQYGYQVAAPGRFPGA